MANILTSMARELLTIEEDLPFRIKYKDGFRPRVDDFELHTFNQTWGSTALGFDGFGGQMITTARTYVFVPNHPELDCTCYVYFGGHFAYKAPYSDLFMEDVLKGNMESVLKSSKYRIEKG